MTRKSKIARLPNAIRQELNERLRDGEPANALLEWLNGLAQVKALLERYFEGRLVTEQNVSEWKNGGYLDWVRDEDARTWLDKLKSGTSALEKSVEGPEISKLYSAKLAVEMTRLGQALLDTEPDPEKRWERVCAVHKQISRLRRDDLWNVRTQVWQERWEEELRKLGRAREDADDKGPGQWMTTEERAAYNHRIWGMATQEDLEILKAGRRRLLSPKAKKQFVAEMMNVSEEEEKEWQEHFKLCDQHAENQKKWNIPQKQQVAEENGEESSAESPTKSNQIQPNPR